MGFLLDKCKLKKMDDEILSTCHPFTCGDEDLDVSVSRQNLRPDKGRFVKLHH